MATVGAALLVIPPVGGVLLVLAALILILVVLEIVMLFTLILMYPVGSMTYMLWNGVKYNKLIFRNKKLYTQVLLESFGASWFGMF